ncbi:MAG: hypothetical protein WDZ94_02290 [Patescibacteria group bacterium]
MSESLSKDINSLRDQLATAYQLHKHQSSSVAWTQAKVVQSELSDLTAAPDAESSQVDQLRILQKELARTLVITGLSSLKKGLEMDGGSESVIIQILQIIHAEYPIGYTAENAQAAAGEWRGVYHDDAPSCIEALEDLVGLCEVLEYIFRDGRFLGFSHALLSSFYLAVDNVHVDHPGLLKFRIKYAHSFDSSQALRQYEAKRGIDTDVCDLDELLILQAHRLVKSRGLSLIGTVGKYLSTIWKGSRAQSGNQFKNLWNATTFAAMELLKKHPKVRAWQLSENIGSVRMSMARNESVVGLSAMLDAKRYVGIDHPEHGEDSAHFLGINDHLTE